MIKNSIKAVENLGVSDGLSLINIYAKAYENRTRISVIFKENNLTITLP